MQVLAPDEFLVEALDSDTRGVLGVLQLQARTWDGGRAVGELLDALERAGVAAFARNARELI